jgi:predicted AAA+ superfamily ATPase
VDLLLVRRLQPYHVNVGKRLVKSPKVYIRNTGLLHALLNIRNRDELLGHPVVSGSWEGYVIENLLAAAPLRTVLGFYRTSGGAEVDLILELPVGNAGRSRSKEDRAANPRGAFMKPARI